MRPQSLNMFIELKIAIVLLLFTFVLTEEHIRIRYTFPDPNIWKVNVRQSPRSARQQTGRNNERSCLTKEGLEGRCCPFATCFYQYVDVAEMHANRCLLKKGEHGVCCPVRGQIRYADDPPFEYRPPPWPVIPVRIKKRHVVQALDQADEDIEAFFRMETNFLRAGQVQQPNSMSSILQNVVGPPNKDLQTLNVHGLRSLEVTKILGQKYDLSPEEMRDGLSQVDLYETPYAKYCPRVPRCNPRDFYRTLDGSCNNLQNPLWGKSNTQYSRVMPPSYSDGICEFRNSVTGVPLPLARVVSNELFITSNKADSALNVMFMQYGQLVDHGKLNIRSIYPSNCNWPWVAMLQHDNSWYADFSPRPIILPDNDPFYLRHNRKCNHFVRNAVGPKNNCNLGYREQTNVITSFIDASMIYGNNFNRSQTVRLGRHGLLKTIQMNDREFLPFDAHNLSIACAVPPNMPLPPNVPRRPCIFAGDVRVNQQIGLLSLQLFFLREHNRLARHLRRINSHWDDEKLYQEARRIVGAEVQHITYNEYVPLLVGRSALKANGLLLQPQGHCDAYDPRVNPSIMNEFASAAYRLHTLVHDVYKLINRSARKSENHRLRRIFNNPALLYRKGAVEEATIGLLSQKSQAFDNIVVEEIRNFLFPASPNARFGMDLISINIQRGRDHGMPPYNALRKACSLPPIRHFRDLNSIMAPGMAERFALVYEHVNDIELWVGGINERPIAGALVGPTFACLITEQFRRLRYGDRFWYENGGMDHSFTSGQLQELRKVSLAGIICENGNDIQRIQPLAMLLKSKYNREVDCKRISQINLQHWKEESNDY